MRFDLRPGQKVLLRRRITGKLRTKCEGPFVFLRTLGSEGAALELLDNRGRVRSAAPANVLPYCGTGHDAAVYSMPKVRVLEVGRVVPAHESDSSVVDSEGSDVGDPGYGPGG